MAHHRLGSVGHERLMGLTMWVQLPGYRLRLHRESPRALEDSRREAHNGICRLSELPGRGPGRLD